MGKGERHITQDLSLSHSHSVVFIYSAFTYALVLFKSFLFRFSSVLCIFVPHTWLGMLRILLAMCNLRFMGQICWISIQLGNQIVLFDFVCLRAHWPHYWQDCFWNWKLWIVYYDIEKSFKMTASEDIMISIHLIERKNFAIWKHVLRD